MAQSNVIPLEQINTKIFWIRDQKVMFDFDLAGLYGVETKVLNQAVTRNIDRFPEDFMFQLSREELENWRSQIVTSNPGARMSLRKPPRSFTEQGIAMLSSVLRSQEAIQVNVAIMRTFVQMREAMLSHKDMARRLDEMERKYNANFAVVFDALRELIETPKPKKHPIGYVKHK